MSMHPIPLRFLAIGECVAELAPAGSPDTYRMGFAGDTFNTAWYLRMLRPDATVHFFSRVGDDSLSDRMLATMAGAGIDITQMAWHGRSGRWRAIGFVVQIPRGFIS